MTMTTGQKLVDQTSRTDLLLAHLDLVGALAEEIERHAEELAMLSAAAVELGRTARVVLRINPDVDAGTHAKISTGRAHDKFGVPYAQAAALYAHAASLPGIRPIGLAVHIGSQILSLAPYRAAYARLAELVRALRTAGHAVETVDCGGGLGIAAICSGGGQGDAILIRVG